MTKSYLPQFTLIFFVLIIILTLVGFSYITSSEISEKRLAQVNAELEIAQFKKLDTLKQLVDVAYARIDPELPSVSTAQPDFFLSQYRAAVRRKDFGKARRFLTLAEAVSSEVVANQEAIIPGEIARLEGRVEASLAEAEDLLANTDDLQERYETSRSDSYDGLSRLAVLRSLVVQLAERINQRRLQMETAAKSIVIFKSQRKLYMYEDENLVYELPVSLGRSGKETRSGEFKILDKMERVWGYYQIWMPYWMGIYFAGSSENGFHGIPWDNAGNRYWENDIGVRNVTYGCVMAEDGGMRKLFNWADVGTPVTVVN